MIVGLLESLRPKQWTKNLLVFAGFLFTVEQGHSLLVLLRVVAAFGLFCAVSGSSYVFNDILDLHADRRHPVKSKRPIADGRVPVVVAGIFASIIGAAAVATSFLLNVNFGLLTVCYLVLAVAYTTALKHILILDLLVITAGFVIRAAAGAVAIEVAISPWLLVCTTLLALFLASAKRRAELSLEYSHTHRRTLADYTAPLLDQIINIAAAACLMSYFLYTFTPASTTGAAHPYMMVTIPFVVYGLFRYLYLIHASDAVESPERLLIEDKPLLVDIALYVVAVLFAFNL